jgi:hypothetical protein
LHIRDFTVPVYIPSPGKPKSRKLHQFPHAFRFRVWEPEPENIGGNFEICAFLVELSPSRRERLYRMTGDMGDNMEIYLTIAELAGLVKLSG